MCRRIRIARAGHEHVVVARAPVDGQLATRQRHLHLAVGALEPRGSDSGRAGGRAAGLGEAGAALPGTDDDGIARDDVGQSYIRTFRKDRMVLEQRPKARQIISVHILDPEDGVRVAHVDHRGRVQHRRINRADLQLDIARIADFLAERDFVPGKTRLAHVDGEQPVGALPADAAYGLEGERALAVLRHNVGDAAHTIAAKHRLPSRHYCKCG